MTRLRFWLLLLLLALPTPAGAFTWTSAQKTTNATNGSEVLAASTVVYVVSLKASCANTVDVTIGPSTINASSAKGRTLAACETFDLDGEGATFNLTEIYLDSGTTAAVVEYQAVGP